MRTRCAIAQLIRVLVVGCSILQIRSQIPTRGFATKKIGQELVGTGRFELPTPRTPSECSTRLSHVPTAGNRSAIERLGFTSKFYTSPLCRVAEQVISISVSALLSAAFVLRQSQIESSF